MPKNAGRFLRRASARRNPFQFPCFAADPKMSPKEIPVPLVTAERLAFARGLYCSTLGDPSPASVEGQPLTPCMPCSFGLLPHPCSGATAQPTGLLEVTVVDR